MVKNKNEMLEDISSLNCWSDVIPNFKARSGWVVGEHDEYTWCLRNMSLETITQQDFEDYKAKANKFDINAVVAESGVIQDDLVLFFNDGKPVDPQVATNEHIINQKDEKIEKLNSEIKEITAENIELSKQVEYYKSVLKKIVE